MDDARRALDELRDKYETILRLRIAHAADDEPDPRAAMAELAQRFPGALRELDALTLDEVRARLDALASAARDPGATAPWMRAHALFHPLMRGALRAKRWLAGRRAVDEAACAAFATACGEDADARAWTEHLGHVAAPPHGRLVNVVFARLAHALDVTPRDARALVFGDRRHDARRRSTRATRD